MLNCAASGNAKQLIAIRIAPQLLRQLRRMAAKQSKPYQTLIHELLENPPAKSPSARAAHAVRH
jgi:predicted DNA binding CopG/RHH family protein